MNGLIVKGIGGFYYIKTEIGLIEAKGRGIFRKQGITLCVGDRVEVSLLDETEKKGVIESILPRKNQFIRPPIANIDTFIVVFLSLIHISEPTRQAEISYAVFCLKKKRKKKSKNKKKNEKVTIFTAR